jgi:hypothetical protein
MSANSFDHIPFHTDDEADERSGECWGMNPESARRQFNVSAVFAAILALAALLVAVLGPVATVNVRREAAQTLVEAPKFKHIQRAEAPLPPGG